MYFENFDKNNYYYNDDFILTKDSNYSNNNSNPYNFNDNLTPNLSNKELYTDYNEEKLNLLKSENNLFDLRNKITKANKEDNNNINKNTDLLGKNLKVNKNMLISNIKNGDNLFIQVLSKYNKMVDIFYEAIKIIKKYNF